MLSSLLPTTASTPAQQHPHPAIQQNLSAPEKGSKMVTDTGLRIENTQDWLRAENRGPGLISDFQAREKIHKFDHERIPERVVHARGAGAWGEFKLHTPIPEYTKANILNEKGKTIPMFVRFSTVLGSRGSADTVRDVRGFAIRFYTEQGNWDIVGNNIPVFFIQDGMKFPDLIHAGKPEPHNEIPQAQTAHDNFWDWSSLMPEASHMMMWQLSDYTIPRSFRHIKGFGVNTFTFTNAKEEMFFVKFHWKPKAGVHSLVWDEALKLNGQDPDFHRRDLYDNIEAGVFPAWEFGVQVLPVSREHEFTFDILDATKVWPEDKVPVKYIGEFVLNRNPSDYFAETEQVAFCTSHLVPGVGFSNDPLLNARNFSYPDTQLTRLGGPNWNEIPINRPMCPVMNNQRDGFGRHRITKSKVNYYPNRFETPDVSSEKEGGYVHFPQQVSGMIERRRDPKWDNHFEQATLFWNSITDIEREHIVLAATFEYSKVEEQAIQEAMLNRLNDINNDFACKVAGNLGLKAPKAKTYHTQTADGLSMLKGNVAACLGTLQAVEGRKAALILADGFDGASVEALQSVFESVKIQAVIVGPRKGDIKSADGKTVIQADFTLSNSRSTHYDSLVLPVHNESGYKTLGSNGNAIHFFMEAYKHQKAIMVYGSDGHKFVREKCHLNTLAPSTQSKVIDGTVFAAEKVGSGMKYADLSGEDEVKIFIDEMAKHRAWNRQVDEVPA